MSIPKLIENISANTKARILRKGLKDLKFGDITWKSTTGSTNQDLLETAKKKPKHLSVAIADHQTAGRGRLEREWLSEKKASLLMSVLFRDDSASDLIGLYSMKLSVAAVKTLHRMGFQGIKIKWPNDLVTIYNGEAHKLSGVLAQTVIKGSDAVVVVGIGINVTLSNFRDHFPEDRISALSEIGEPPKVIDLAEGILRELVSPAMSDNDLKAEYEKNSHTLGSLVEVSSQGKKFVGIAISLTKSGALLIESEDGSLKEISVGDVTHLREKFTD